MYGVSMINGTCVGVLRSREQGVGGVVYLLEGILVVGRVTCVMYAGMEAAMRVQFVGLRRVSTCVGKK